MRAFDLCANPTFCSASCEAVCSCGHAWEPEDTAAPGHCPECGGFQITIERCDACPVSGIEHHRNHSEAGRLLQRVLNLQFDCKHFEVPISMVTAEERIGLRVLNEEIDRYTREQQEEHRLQQ